MTAHQHHFIRSLIMSLVFAGCVLAGQNSPPTQPSESKINPDEILVKVIQSYKALDTYYSVSTHLVNLTDIEDSSTLFMNYFAVGYQRENGKVAIRGPLDLVVDQDSLFFKHPDLTNHYLNIPYTSPVSYTTIRQTVETIYPKTNSKFPMLIFDLGLAMDGEFMIPIDQSQTRMLKIDQKQVTDLVQVDVSLREMSAPSDLEMKAPIIDDNTYAIEITSDDMKAILLIDRTTFLIRSVCIFADSGFLGETAGIPITIYIICQRMNKNDLTRDPFLFPTDHLKRSDSLEEYCDHMQNALIDFIVEYQDELENQIEMLEDATSQMDSLIGQLESDILDLKEQELTNELLDQIKIIESSIANTEAQRMIIFVELTKLNNFLKLIPENKQENNDK